MSGGSDRGATIVRELSRPEAPHLVTLVRTAAGELQVRKALRPAYRGRDDLALRLRLEAGILRELGGRAGVVRLVGSSDDPPALTMEYLPGGSMAAVIAAARERLTPFSLHHAVSLGRALLDVLAYVHEHGVVHRDVKPANLLFAGDGSLHVVDFGVAARADPARGGAAFGLPADWIEERVGTVPYCAPESVLRPERPATPAQDVYSVAVVLFELLTGRLPFRPEQGETPEHFAERVVSWGDVSRVVLAAGLNSTIGGALAAALHPDPARRIGSAEELASRL